MGDGVGRTESQPSWESPVGTLHETGPYRLWVCGLQL